MDRDVPSRGPGLAGRGHGDRRDERQEDSRVCHGPGRSATRQWEQALDRETGSRRDALAEVGDLLAADLADGTEPGAAPSATALQWTAPASAEALVQAARQASHAVWQRIEADHSLDGMGTTLTAAAALQADSQSRLAIVNIGDSRAYTYADGQMQQLTRDHSVVQGLIEAGRVSQDQWRQHPQRHLLTRAIGLAATIEPDISLPLSSPAPG